MSGSADRTLRVWDLERGKETDRFTGAGAMCSVAVDETRGLVVAGDHTGAVHIREMLGEAEGG